MLLWQWVTRCTPLEATAPGRTMRHFVRLMCTSSTQVCGKCVCVWRSIVSFVKVFKLKKYIN